MAKFRYAGKQMPQSGVITLSGWKTESGGREPGNRFEKKVAVGKEFTIPNKWRKAVKDTERSPLFTRIS